MKLQITLFLLFLSSWIGHSQIGPNDDAIYLDSLNNLGNEKNFKFIRVVKEYAEDKDLYDVYFYSRSGKLVQRATTSNKFFMAFEGPYIYYYENGNKQKMETYSDKRVNGRQFEWYENGNLKLETDVQYDKKTKNSSTKIINYWSANKEQKVINGEGEYEEIETIPNSNSAKFSVKSSGKIKNYVKDGLWKGKSEKPSYTFYEQFENGKLVSGKRIDSLGVEIQYIEVLQKPKPKNGIADFYRFVGENYNTPAVQGLKGVIYATFVVDKEGKVADVKIIRDLGYGTGAEAIRVIQKYDQWIPGSFKGEPVRVQYSLPITIQSNY